MHFVYGALTRYGRTFQNRSTMHHLCNSSQDLVPLHVVPTTPNWQYHQACHQLGLGCSLFARRYWGSRCCFYFLGVLRCFNSPGSLP